MKSKVGTMVRMMVLAILAIGSVFSSISTQAQAVMVIHYKTEGIFDPAPNDDSIGLLYTDLTESPQVSLFQEAWTLTNNQFSMYPKLIPLQPTVWSGVTSTISTPYYPVIPRAVATTGYFKYCKYWGDYTFSPITCYGRVVVRLNFSKPYSNAIISPGNLQITPLGVVISDGFKDSFVPIFVPQGATQFEFKVKITPIGYMIE